MTSPISHRRRLASVLACAWALSLSLSCGGGGSQQTFATPEDAVKQLVDVARRGTLDDLMKILGPDAQPLVESSDPTIARQHRQVFVVAAREGWRLQETGANSRTLIVGNESWPFPVPLVKDGNRWRFDTATGVEEVVARRIGRNELAVIRACRTYVFAQRLYARHGHDGKPAGLYAATFRSDAGKQNGLYWPAVRGERRSPLGDLVAQAAGDGAKPSPFHGYYFRILKAQGPDAPGGAKDYIVKGEMSGGFALVAWPAIYDGSGVMTFMVNQDGTVREKDLGPDTVKAASAIAIYNPDATWSTVQ
jgi:hypothetical protein